MWADHKLRKGANFLNGALVPRVAVIDKRTSHKSYYLNEPGDTVTIRELMLEEEWWNAHQMTMANNPFITIDSPQMALL